MKNSLLLSRFRICSCAVWLAALAAFIPARATAQINFLEADVNGSSGITNLNSPSDVAVSPDSRHVYVACYAISAVVIFSRDASTGALTYVGNIQQGVGGVDGISTALGVVVSPDGKNVYAGSASSTIGVFSRDATTGLLTFVESDATSTHTGNLQGVVALTVSPDGGSVYGVTGSRPGLIVFSRNSVDGRLTFTQSFADNAVDVPGITNALGQFFSATNNPIKDIAVTTDGAFFYIASTLDSAVMIFSRDPTTGTLTPSAVVKDGVGGVSGITTAASLVLSPDNQFLYVTGQSSGSVAIFARNATTGALTYVDKVIQGSGGVTTLTGARCVTISPDGRYIYVSGISANSITVFNRDSTTGLLTLATSVTNGTGGVTGIANVCGLTVDPLGMNLYAAGQSSSAVAVFRLPTPSVTLSSTSALNYHAGDPALVVDAALAVSDPFSPTFASAEVDLGTGFFAGDTLSVTTSGNVSASYDGSVGHLTLTGVDTLATYQSILRTVSYHSTAADPTNGGANLSKNVSFTVFNGQNESGAAVRSISIPPPPPAVTISGPATSFLAAGSPVAVNASLTVTDPGSSTLASATVSITTNFASGEDVLGFANDSVTMGNITGSYSSGTGVLTLTSAGATATLAQWQAALRAVTYNDNSATPNTSARTVSFVIDDGTETSAATTQSVVIAAVAQTITFGPLADHDATDGPIMLSAVASSGLPVTFSVVSGPATVSGNTLTLSGSTGTVVVRAAQAGNSTYAAAANVDQSFAVGFTSQTITFGPLANHSVTDGPIALSAIASSGLTVTFTVVSGPATISGTTLTLAGGAGTVVVRAAQAGNGTYAAAPNVDQSFAVGLISQTITFGSLADHGVTDGPIPLSATASSGLTVTFTVVSGPASVSGNALTLSGSAGAVVVRAAQAGNGTYAAAPNVDQSFAVGLVAQTITFGALADHSATDSPIALSATASSGLPVVFTVVSGPAAVSGNTLTLAGNAGTVVVRAAQAGNGTYAAAPNVDRSFTVNAVAQAQVIHFDALPNHGSGDASFTLNATTSSGLPVTFTVISGPAMLNGDTLTLTGAPGTVVIRASQGGNASYGAAAYVDQSFTVTQAGPNTFFGNIVPLQAPTSVSGGDVHATGTAGSGTFAAEIDTEGMSGSLIGYLPATGEGFVVNFTLDGAGSFVVKADTFTASGATQSRTFRGTLSGNTFSGRIDELGLGFQASVEPRNGSTAALAGYYISTSLATATGSTYCIVGTQGEIYVLALTPTVVDGAAATIAADGSFAASVADGITVAGHIDAGTTTVSSSLAQAGQPTVNFAGLASTTSRTDRLVNLSSRALVGTSQNVLISGFVISGTEPKQVLIRAVGPGLASAGVGAVLANPTLSIYSGTTVAAENDDWGAAANAADIAAAAARVGAFALDAGSKDAALLVTLSPGTYSAVVGGGSGIALVEVYDASINPQADYQRLVNISSRGQVGQGENILIGGFVVTGNAPKHVLIRGVGPTLTQYGVSGVLADPRLSVYQGATVIGQNDNWSADPTAATAVAAAATRVGAFPLPTGSADASLVMTLAPGPYSVQISGVNGATGVALVEIYEIQE